MWLHPPLCFCRYSRDNTFTSTSHNAWKGHAFERGCLQRVPQIKAALGIAGVQTNVCSWFSRGSEERRGAQIDLVMRRADGFTDLCEMKHSANVFTIDRDYAANLQNKIEVYQELSKDNRALHLVSIGIRIGDKGQYRPPVSLYLDQRKQDCLYRKR